METLLFFWWHFESRRFSILASERIAMPRHAIEYVVFRFWRSCKHKRLFNWHADYMFTHSHSNKTIIVVHRRFTNKASQFFGSFSCEMASETWVIVKVLLPLTCRWWTRVSDSLTADIPLLKALSVTTLCNGFSFPFAAFDKIMI